MNKFWQTTEKVIGIIQILLGLFIISVTTYILYNVLDNFMKPNHLQWQDLSFYKIFKNYHLSFIIPLLFLISGVLLLKNKIAGWIIGVATWITIGIGEILSIGKVVGNKYNSWTDWNTFYLLLFTIFACSIAILMLTIEFRKKYNPNWKNWLVMFSIILFLTLDRLLIK